MKGHGEKLSRKKQQAIAALLEEPTVEQAASRAGVSAVTLWRWRQLPEFQDAFIDAQDQLVSDSRDRLRYAGRKAIETLIRNLDCGIPAVEVRAAATSLDLMLKAIEAEDLRHRIEKLESAQDFLRHA